MDEYIENLISPNIETYLTKDVFSSNKRPHDTSVNEEKGDPVAKSARFELDDSDSACTLEDDLLVYVKKYMSKHISDKTIKEKILEDNPIPENIPKPSNLDFYIKELLDEQFNHAKTMRADGYLVSIQSSI